MFCVRGPTKPLDLSEWMKPNTSRSQTPQSDQFPDKHIFLSVTIHTLIIHLCQMILFSSQNSLFNQWCGKENSCYLINIVNIKIILQTHISAPLKHCGEHLGSASWVISKYQNIYCVLCFFLRPHRLNWAGSTSQIFISEPAALCWLCLRSLTRLSSLCQTYLSM